MTTVLRVEQLHRSFEDGSGNEIAVLKGVDLQFKKNQTVSIVGSSGSGKSTLLHLLGGLDHPSSGKIFYKDEDIYSYSSDDLSDWRNRNIGFVFQSHHLLPDFTALENILLPGMISGLSKSQCLKKADELLEQIGLKERASHKPGQLSGGEQQRIAIARALINSPDIILADEPTGNLDTNTGGHIGNLLMEVCRQRQATLVVVTHNLQLAGEMDYQLVLKNGILEGQ